MFSHVTKKTVISQSCPGVSFVVRIISYARRHALAGKVRQILEQAGLRSLDEMEKIELLAALEVSRQIDRAYFQEMLVAAAGLEVDGRVLEAGPETLDDFLDSAPEALVAEIAAAIRGEVSLTEEQEKNFAAPGGTPSAVTPGTTNVPPASGTAYGGAVIAAGSTPIA